MTVDQVLEQYFTEDDVCKLLGWSLSTLRSARCRDADHPTPLKRGNRILYLKDTFIPWFTGRNVAKVKRVS